MAKKKKVIPAQAPTLFEVEAIVQVKHEVSKKIDPITHVNTKFDHMASGINRAYLAGESIISNRNNSISDGKKSAEEDNTGDDNPVSTSE